MRALVVSGPGLAGVREVPEPRPAAGELVAIVERVGICGTDVELFTGEMAYFDQGHTHFPIILGHEWTGRVVAVGEDSDQSWLGRRIVGETMLGCGDCKFCGAGKHHVCPHRFEVGIRDGWPGALAEQMLIPARFAHVVPESVSVAAAALVEPGGNALHALDETELSAGDRLLILGSGTIGLLAAQFAVARGLDVHVAGIRPPSLRLARELGVRHTHDLAVLSQGTKERFGAVIDATSLASSPALAVELVEPAGRVVFVGLSSTPSSIDSRALVLRDVTAVGMLSGSPGLAGAIAMFASGACDPEPLVSEVVGLDEVASRLAGHRGEGAGPGPKVHVDPGR
jgi:2-desacetyl-2-hydroxyethyl bacteriochlorophyllide A dehydrogenase